MKIKVKILIPVIIVIIILLSFTFFCVHYVQDKYYTHDRNEHINEIESAFNRSLLSESNMLASHINYLLQDSKIQQDFLNKHRADLYNYCLPIFNKIKSEFKITHFYFIDTTGECYLRIHNVSKYGGTIDRFTFIEAQQTQKPAHGIELGTFGTFTLRYVNPIIIDSKVVGYIELGMEIGHITPTLKEINNVDLIFLINKKFTSKDKWEIGLKMLGKQGNWDEYSDYVVIDKTTNIKFDLEELIDTKKNKQVIIKSENRSFQVGEIPLIDVGNRNLGKIFLFSDITEQKEPIQNLMILISIISFFIALCLLYFFYKYISSIESKITFTHNEIIKAKRNEEINKKYYQDLFEYNPVSLWDEDLSKLQQYIDEKKREVDNFENFVADNPDFVKLCASMIIINNINKSSLNMFKAESKEQLIKHLNQTFSKKSVETFKDIIVAISNNAKTFTAETEYSKLDGSIMFAIVNLFRFENYSKSIIVITDITEQKKATRALNESENKYKILFEKANDAIFIADVETGKLIDVNKKGELLLGRERNTIIGMHQQELHPENIRKESEHIFKTHSEITDENLINELFVVNERGDRILVEISPSIVEINNKKCVYGIFRDITKRKKAELALKESEEKYRFLLNNLGEGVGSVDENEKFIFANTKAETLFGVENGKLVGSSLKEFLSEKDYLYIKQQTLKRKEGDKDTYELDIINKKNRKVNLLITPTPEFDINGNFKSTFAVFRDISERKKSQQALKEKEEYFRTLIENNNDVISILDKKGNSTFRSSAYERIIGYKTDEVTDNFKYIHDDDKERLQKQLFNLLNKYGETETIYYRFLHKNGTWRNIEGTAKNLLKNSLINGIVLNYRDVTERKQIEDKLKLSYENYRLIIENSNDAIVVNQNGKNVFFNKSFSTMLGYTKAELIDIDLMNLFAQDSQQVVEIYLEHAQKQEIFKHRLELKIKKKSGKFIDVEIDSKKIEFDGDNAIFSVIRDITKQKEIMKILQRGAEQTKGLNEFIPICAGCSLIRDDEKEGNPWVKPADYISERLPDIKFSHTMCPDCLKKWYPELDLDDE